MSLLTLQPRLVSRPFVSLTQDARIAEEDKNMVVSKDYLLPKQRHLTAEDAEKTMIQRPTSKVNFLNT
ncbi:unnamed protein product [marine sediment metagenome]|uniref:Uncharacterized protein n=1 Tax=marine sediment metagenome TaxID=412755 RepID=X0XKR4_9ZZZZ